MKPPRGLSEAEKALWLRVAQTITPLHPAKAPGPVPQPARPAEPVPKPARPAAARSHPAKPSPARPATPLAPPRQAPPPGLDSHWDRRLRNAAIAPDFTLDLHGHSLDQAHRRLETGLAQARAMGARLVLVVTGRPRPVDAADRASRRGAIRAKIVDWLAAGAHASAIAAIRPAHRRHGGEGALYIVLKRDR